MAELDTSTSGRKKGRGVKRSKKRSTRVDPTKLKSADFISIRNIILDKKRRTNPKWFEVVLKPTADANYKNIVDILDEMTINDIRHFVLVEPTPEELTNIKARP